MKNKIDFRSDTVTQPTQAMREAMAHAEVGDDVLQEDKTINHLQELAAERMGMEAGLFVASGTMGNLLAVMTHCGHGGAAFMGNVGHTYIAEAGGAASIAGVHSHALPLLSDGSLDLDIASEILADQENVHHPDCRLIIIENTQNYAGGLVIDSTRMQETACFARNNHLFSHVDGARIFNAQAASNTPAKELVKGFDSVSFCLSKGLCAPVGSVLCGSEEFIKRARKKRKMLGGGMRQAGILAAAGIIAIEEMSDRLGEDHGKATSLATNIADNPLYQVERRDPPTNMVFLQFADEKNADDFCDYLKVNNILVGKAGAKRVRFVTHYWISDSNVEQTIKAIAKWRK